MAELLSQISAFLPVFLASPTMYAGMLLIMAAPRYPRRRAFAAWVGCLLMALALGALLLAAGGAALDPREPSRLSGAINIALGILLVLLGVRRALGKGGRHRKSRQRRPVAGEAVEPALLKFAGVGVLLTITNPTSLASFLAAAKLTIDSGLNEGQQAAAMAVAAVYFTLPILVPLLLALSAPQTAARFLKALEGFLEKNGRYVAAVMLVVLGLYLLKKGYDIISI